MLACAAIVPFQAAAAVQQKPFEQTGIASWYGREFRGHKTANGERYNPDAMTAAHRKLPFGTMVRVTSLRNNRSVVVRINNRGPYIRGRIIDISAAAASQLDMIRSGIARVRIEVVQSNTGG